ncbi:hypothetical protein E2C01_037697 [Portunus trituberculatus]|uniref:Uncharacterized protein n=1 Tax=Portunus trituberculatus TaxID=210409 RepID=A0A5B7FFA0_PORTR|nr:hypothetical protein [Portunus trituberculatus]
MILDPDEFYGNVLPNDLEGSSNFLLHGNEFWQSTANTASTSPTGGTGGGKDIGGGGKDKSGREKRSEDSDSFLDEEIIDVKDGEREREFTYNFATGNELHGWCPVRLNPFIILFFKTMDISCSHYTLW